MRQTSYLRSIPRSLYDINLYKEALKSWNNFGIAYLLTMALVFGLAYSVSLHQWSMTQLDRLLAPSNVTFYVDQIPSFQFQDGYFSLVQNKTEFKIVNRQDQSLLIFQADLTPSKAIKAIHEQKKGLFMGRSFLAVYPPFIFESTAGSNSLRLFSGGTESSQHSMDAIKSSTEFYSLNSVAKQVQQLTNPSATGLSKLSYTYNADTDQSALVKQIIDLGQSLRGFQWTFLLILFISGGFIYFLSGFFTMLLIAFIGLLVARLLRWPRTLPFKQWLLMGALLQTPYTLSKVSQDILFFSTNGGRVVRIIGLIISVLPYLLIVSLMSKLPSVVPNPNPKVDQQ